MTGSGKYLSDRKSSTRQERITFQYKSINDYTPLTMELLRPEGIDHPFVFEMDIATHVVTGIEYGADAFFVFDRQVSSTETNDEMQGNANVLVERLKGKGRFHYKYQMII